MPATASTGSENITVGRGTLRPPYSLWHSLCHWRLSALATMYTTSFSSAMDTPKNFARDSVSAPFARTIVPPGGSRLAGRVHYHAGMSLLGNCNYKRMFGFLHVFHLVSDDSVLSIKVPKRRRTAYAFKTDKIGDAVVWLHLCASLCAGA